MSSLADANRQWFDAISEAYDKKPFFAKMNQQVTDYLNDHVDWVGLKKKEEGDGEIKMLDYACGPGVMARIFAPYVSAVKGIDISPNMVDKFNANFQSPASPIQAQAVVGDLFDKANASPDDFSGPEYRDFDLATVGFGFHHFEDVVYAAKALKERLRPGGVLLISDFLEGGDMSVDEATGKPLEGSEGNHFDHLHAHTHGHHGHGHQHRHEHQHQHQHHGHGSKESSGEPSEKYMNASIVVPSFTIDGVKKFFAEAGLVDTDVVIMPEKVYMEFGGKKFFRTVIFARGRRPLEQ